MAVAVSAERCVRGQLRTTEEFCTKCGTTIGPTLEWRPGVRLIDAGTFDDPSWISADRHQFRYIFLRSAQKWSNLPPGADQYEKHFAT